MIGIDVEISGSELRAHVAQVKAGLATIEHQAGVDKAIACAIKNCVGSLEYIFERMGDNTALAVVEALKQTIVEHEMAHAARQTKN